MGNYWNQYLQDAGRESVLRVEFSPPDYFRVVDS